MRSIVYYTLSSLISVLITFITSGLLARHLSVEDFGFVRLLGDVMPIATSVFSLGLPSCAARLVAQPEHRHIRAQLAGEVFRISVLQALPAMALVFGIGSWLAWAKADVGYKWLCFASPFVLAYLLRETAASIQVGLGQIRQYACFEAGLPAATLCVLLLLRGWCGYLTLPLVIAATQLVRLLFALARGYLLQPKLVRNVDAKGTVLRELRSYGVHVYVGTLGSVVAAQSLALLGGCFLKPDDYACLSLSLAIGGLLGMIGAAYATTHYHVFALQEEIPTKDLARLVLGSLAGWIVYVCVVTVGVEAAFPSSYRPVATYAAAVGWGSVLHGMGDTFNRFLNAKGRGQKVRNIALASGAVSIGVTLCLGYSFHMWGIIIGRISLGLTYCILGWAAYRSHCRGTIRCS